jgi:hypothetical protein
MSATTVQPVFSATDWHLDLASHAPSTVSLADAGTDHPVDDTGPGHKRGDLQHSVEFACLIKLICEERGEFA